MQLGGQQSVTHDEEKGLLVDVVPLLLVDIITNEVLVVASVVVLRTYVHDDDFNPAITIASL
jgi:hypothetical protein